MSYPRELDEYSMIELQIETQRRLNLRAEGKCDYCGRLVKESKCRFPERHVLMTSNPAARIANGLPGNEFK